MTVIHSTLRACSTAALGAAALTLGACGGVPGYGMSRPGVYAGSAVQRSQMPDIGAIQAKQQLMQDLMSNPDLPAWHDERQKLTMAVGDRVFDKSFDEVFDGMVIALATLGSRVNNMDRGSGYITGSIPDLGPERNEELQRESLAEYVKIKGYPESVLKRQGAFDLDPSMGRNMMARMGGSGLTLTMVHQTAHQTKVKLRFDNVYYPKTSQELYRYVWVAVDRQMFLDKALDH